MSLMSMGEDAGGALAPMLAGFLWATWGVAALMGARVLLAIAAEVYAIVVTRTAGERAVRNTGEEHAEKFAVLANSPAEE